MKHRNLLISSFAALLGLTGCDVNDNVNHVPAKGNINGLVVVPVLQSTDKPASGCSALPIPGGYLPLADANVTLLDENGSAVASQMTDSCGRFYLNAAPAGLTSVRLAKNGFHTMVSDISFFDNGGDGWGIVSTADINNSFAVRVNTEGHSMSFDSKTGNFKYSVIDTKTRHAVLGIPKSNVQLYKDKNETQITDYIFNDLHADLILSMDASGSMDSDVYGFNGTDYVVLGNRLDFAFMAAKQFISELSGNAKLGINIFDGNINYFDYDFINSFSFTDNNKSVKIDYARDGFETDKQLSKFVIDIYHPDSEIYEGNLTAEFPYRTSEAYKWGGLTALYDVAYDSVKTLAQREGKKIAVLMTDGYDTVRESDRNFNDSIKIALENNIPFYTIAVGGDIDGAELESLAKKTGGAFLRAEGADLSEKFADILSDIQYYYEVGTPIEENSTAFYRVDVNVSGEIVSGLVEYNATLPVLPETPVETESGAQLYAKCMPCHGVYGEQSAYGVTVAINELNATTLKTTLEAYKAGTQDSYGYGDVMHAQINAYSEEDINTLSEYIPSLLLSQYGVTDLVSDETSNVDDTELDGATLYAKCSACHGTNGEKEALGKSGVIGGVNAETIAADLFGYRDSDLNKYGMGALMKGQVATYSDAQIQSVAQYISTLSGD